MPQKKKQASKPIEIEDSEEISESQKKHYEKLGYKPYLSHTGKIKWLSVEQHTYELIKYNKKKKSIFHIGKLRTPKNPMVARLFSNFFKFLLRNWFFVTLLILIVILLINIRPLLDIAANIKI